MVMQAFADILRDDLIPDAYCYAIVIDTCAALADKDNAELWMQKMEDAGVAPNSICFQCMMKACANAKHPDAAGKWFRLMQAAGHKTTTVSYNVLISAYTDRLAESSSHEGKRPPDFQKALEWFNELMQSSLRPSAQTYASFINAHAQLGSHEDSLCWLQQKTRAGFPHAAQDCGMMMNAYANKGQVALADEWLQKLFQIAGRLEVYDYTTLLKACAKARDPDRAKAFFLQQLQQGVQPDQFNLRTLESAVGHAKFQLLCADLTVDTAAVRADFVAVGDELSFDKEFLKRKPWKMNKEQVSIKRNSFGPSSDWSH